jgi:signal transduction histidine kinase
MQRDVVLPAKAGIILVVVYYFFYSGWLYEVPTTRSVLQEVLKNYFLIYVLVLWLLTLCCYGAQVLWERQRVALEEAGEFAARENQLHSAGRLAAEFAHQIKNPLAIINNAAYSLQRSLHDAGGPAAQQIEIIREEVARADRSSRRSWATPS